jgi:hypothetical protein
MATLSTAACVEGRQIMGIGFSIFLFVVGAILTWSRRRSDVGPDRVIEGRRIERDLS